MSENVVQNAIDLIKSGQKEEGKNLLMKLIIDDPYNEEAWLWMSSASSGEERITCLQKALEINPHNEHARKMLEQYSASSTAQGKPKAPRTAQQADQPEEEIVFSPDAGIVFLAHILPWIVIFAYIIVFAAMVDGWLETQHIIIMAAVAVVVCILMMIRKMSAYKVRISKTAILAPRFFTQAWFKHELPIAEIDLKKTGTSLGFIGYYRIRSTAGASIYLIAYGEEKFLQIASLIRHYQSH